MFGSSGAEFATLDSPSGAVLVCRAGCPAYIPEDPPDGTSPLRSAATTAYMTLLPGTGSASGLPYYAQPLQAPLYLAKSRDLGEGFLEFHPMLSGSLPPQAQASDLSSYLFPSGAYRWLAPADIELARTLEAAVLAPTRRAVIGGNPVQDTPPRMEHDALPLASTPQGLLAKLSADGSEWAGVLFANLPSSNQTLIFTPVGKRFAQALQSNQLFFVVADVEEFLRQSGAGSDGLNCTLDGWTFRLSPDDWRPQAQPDPTLMLFKYCNRTLIELADDTSVWGWPEAAGDIPRTQRQLQALLAAAGEHAVADPPVPGDPYAIFYDEVANNPAWNGVLFFNVPVDLGQMPPDLAFLAAGIDPAKFYAHHAGFSVTPVRVANGVLTPGQTAAFGLVDYEDTEDLAPSRTVPFGYKTLRLEIRFANARIAEFAAQCELLVNVLFGAPLTKLDPSHGNNLIMNGSCQRVDGLPSYSFVLDGENLFSAQGSAIVSVEPLSVRMDTAAAAEGDPVVASSFTLEGNLRFIKLAELDMFSYGAVAGELDGFLRFTGLSIRMEFDRSDPMEQTFTPFENDTSLDPASSVPRPTSLAANFPLQAAGIVVVPAEGEGQGLTPEQMGFVSIACPLDQTPMTAPWVGLLFTIDLGSLGALSGSLALSMSMLMAWSPGAGETLPVYLGLKLASFVPRAGSLPLQGVLKLGFRSFELIAYEPAPDQVGYQLWMRRFALSILAWSFPPGNADLVLFGEPDNPRGSLGWYAAYDAKPDSQGPAALQKAGALDAAARRLASGRRMPPVA